MPLPAGVGMYACDIKSTHIIVQTITLLIIAQKWIVFQA